MTRADSSELAAKPDFRESFAAYLLPPSERLGVEGCALTVREVADRLGVSTASVYGLVRRGELRHFRVSNSIRVVAFDLDAFSEAGRTDE